MPDPAPATDAVAAAPPAALPGWVRFTANGAVARVVGPHSTGDLIVEDAAGYVWIVSAGQYEPVNPGGLG